MLRNGHLKIFEPTYGRVSALIFKEDREAKEESEQKPESEDKDRAVGRSENPWVPIVVWGHIQLLEGLADLPKSGGALAPPAPTGMTALKDEQVENPTSLENVKTEEEAQMEIKEAKNAHPESNITTGLEIEESIKVKDDKKTKLEAETVEEKAKPRIEDETTTAEAEVYMTPGSTWSTESNGSKESKGSKDSKGSKGSTGSTVSTGSMGSTEAKLEGEENVILETKNAEMAQHEAEA